MRFVMRYRTPTGLADLLMSSDGEVLTGLWFEGSADEAKHRGDFVVRNLPIVEKPRRSRPCVRSERLPAEQSETRMNESFAPRWTA